MFKPNTPLEEIDKELEENIVPKDEKEESSSTLKRSKSFHGRPPSPTEATKPQPQKREKFQTTIQQQPPREVGRGRERAGAVSLSDSQAVLSKKRRESMASQQPQVFFFVLFFFLFFFFNALLLFLLGPIVFLHSNLFLSNSRNVYFNVVW